MTAAAPASGPGGELLTPARVNRTPARRPRSPAASRPPSASTKGPAPLSIREARGPHLVDIDGREYVDFACGFGPLILGQGHERVTAAVVETAHTLQRVGAKHESSSSSPELLCDAVPAFELVRLSYTGSDAIQCRWRPRARGHRPTARRQVRQPVHGWLDGF
jgi:glutamate-1-semialdehyde 2,1-aminomutase